jgi:hypothetical protein
MTIKKDPILYVIVVESIKLHSIQLNLKVDEQCTPEDIENQMARLVVRSLIKADIIRADWKRITKED